MERFLWILKSTVQEQEPLAVVRQEVHAEIVEGGKAFSERQQELTRWQQADFAPTILGLIGGCGAITLCRRYGFLKKGPRLMVLIPAFPCYIIPYQVSFHVRETEYLIEMMREDRQKFARRLRKKFEVACASSNRPSAILEDLESGAEIEE
eukprot:TRINITY_DN99325_c0_g1_i1.p2 TRINITY_DN99325_c0_g1~~TRINITY_DN99325_c0_g1_i1.p2  ORF type:complete len:151 (+),score=28.68 TRINITY_DN99325_c0_g1_i1:45-497(+)